MQVVRRDQQNFLEAKQRLLVAGQLFLLLVAHIDVIELDPSFLIKRVHLQVGIDVVDGSVDLSLGDFQRYLPLDGFLVNEVLFEQVIESFLDSVVALESLQSIICVTEAYNSAAAIFSPC